jgi:hypothetical protein
MVMDAWLLTYIGTLGSEGKGEGLKLCLPVDVFPTAEA